MEIPILRGRGTLGAWEPMWNSMGFVDFVNFWKCQPLLAKNSFNFKLGFFTNLEYISGVSSEKNNLRSDDHSARWYWCKKDQKNLLQSSHKMFSQCFIVNSWLLSTFMVQNICNNSFFEGKSRKMACQQ